jgi:hypothetical protein
MGRPQWIPPSDSWNRYLKPRDGRLALLKVQGTDDSHHPHDHVTWKRDILIDQTPLILKLINWCTKSVPEFGSQSAKQQQIQGQVSHSAAQGQGDNSNSVNVKQGFLSREWRKKYLSRDQQKLYLKWIPTCLGLLFLVILFSATLPNLMWKPNGLNTACRANVLGGSNQKQWFLRSYTV